MSFFYKKIFFGLEGLSCIVLIVGMNREESLLFRYACTGLLSFCDLNVDILFGVCFLYHFALIGISTNKANKHFLYPYELDGAITIKGEKFLDL